MFPPETFELVAGTLLDGKFRVVRTIGAGGMGAVYEVVHELTKHRRALKVLHPQYSASAAVVTRFLREASAAGRIGNSHIVETFDAGRLQNGAPYIVMELLSGQALDSLLRDKGRLEFDEAIEYMTQASWALQAAHDAGIVHRDIKPDNLFVSAGPFVKILDFGISKFDLSLTGGQKLTQVGTPMGTPYYMSPEQVRGEAHIDARTDIYSLSAVLYECATGHKPFMGDSTQEIAVRIHEGNPPPLSNYRPDLPEGFAAVVARGMSVDATQRYPTMRAFADALLAVRSAPATRPLFPALHAPVATEAVTAGATAGGPPLSLGDGASTASGGARGRLGAQFALIAGVVAFALVGVIAMLLWLRRPTAAPKTELVPGPSASVMPVVTGDEGPRVMTVVDQDSEPALEVEPPPPPAPPRASAPKKPQEFIQRTRAREHGLAEENPFGQ